MPDWTQAEPFDLVVLIGFTALVGIIVVEWGLKQGLRQWRIWRVRRLVRRWRDS